MSGEKTIEDKADKQRPGGLNQAYEAARAAARKRSETLRKRSGQTLPLANFYCTVRLSTLLPPTRFLQIIVKRFPGCTFCIGRSTQLAPQKLIRVNRFLNPKSEDVSRMEADVQRGGKFEVYLLELVRFCSRILGLRTTNTQSRVFWTHESFQLVLDPASKSGPLPRIANELDESSSCK